MRFLVFLDIRERVERSVTSTCSHAYDVALRINIGDNYESTLFANWGYDTTNFDAILMSVIRGPGHLDKSMNKMNQDEGRSLRSS
jgi:hypothetical protein